MLASHVDNVHVACTQSDCCMLSDLLHCGPQHASVAGKTTLINHILSQDHGRRVAVIENEFGEVGIDNDLIVSKENLDGDDLMILENGCLCCTVRDDLVEALNSLVKRGGFDQVLVETTGELHLVCQPHLCCALCIVARADAVSVSAALVALSVVNGLTSNPPCQLLALAFRRT
jgi:CobW/HypB/UreG, nucleotide-binding domain